MATMISSQRFLDDEIVAAKKESGDFIVFISPEFEIEGEKYRVVLDGHHSFAAAKELGVAAEIVEQDERDNDNICILGQDGPEAFLGAVWMDSDYYDINSGINVF